MTDFTGDDKVAFDEAAEEQMVAVLSYPSEQDARERAKLLVENGIGAVIERGLPPDHVGPEPYEDPVADRDTDEYAASFELRVMRHQVERACEILGVDPPELAEAEGETSTGGAPPWKMILIIWAIAIVVIPLAAFLLTYNLLK
ncbi:MAG: hypothetical protein HYX32_07210 [Actinobacteria bacterium]|nr:hypothetical protein [Actinomycetota bacterium]